MDKMIGIIAGAGESPLYALKKAQEKGKTIISTKCLAGGRIKTEDALNFTYKKMCVDACMIGVGSEDEIREDLSVTERILRS